jgi:hypothetical protein
MRILSIAFAHTHRLSKAAHTAPKKNIKELTSAISNNWTPKPDCRKEELEEIPK